MKSPLQFILVLVVAAWCWGCGDKPTPQPPQGASAPRQTLRTVTDDLGQQFSLAQPPRRIVSLAPNATEILYALGLGERIVAVTQFSDYPPAAGSKPQVGSYDRPSIEKIVACKPDLVIFGFGSSKELAKTLGRFKIPAFAINPQSMEEILQTITRIGDLCGVSSRADKLTAELHQRIQKAQAGLHFNNRQRPRVFIMVDQDPLWTAGAQTLQDEILRLAGGENVASGKQGFYAYSKESIFAAQPDILLLPVRTDQTKSMRNKVLARKDLAGLQAIRQKKVVTIDADAFSRPGPRAFDAVDELARALAHN
jgi:iron complex transport system substrate-binding protein